jgi:hypothetical protein
MDANPFFYFIYSIGLLVVDEFVALLLCKFKS